MRTTTSSTAQRPRETCAGAVIKQDEIRALLGMLGEIYTGKASNLYNLKNYHPAHQGPREDAANRYQIIHAGRPTKVYQITNAGMPDAHQRNHAGSAAQILSQQLENTGSRSERLSCSWFFSIVRAHLMSGCRDVPL